VQRVALIPALVLIANLTYIRGMTKYLIPALLLLLPLLWLPFTLNFFATPKILLLLLIVVALIVQLVVTLLKSHTITLPKGALTLPLVLIIATTLLNLIINSVARPESLLSTGGVLLLMPVLSFFILTTKTPRKLTRFAFIATISGTSLLSLFSLLQLTVLYRIAALPTYLATRTFTPTGSLLVTLILLALGGGLSLIIALRLHFHKNIAIIAAVVTAFHAIALIAYFALLVPGGELTLTFLPYQASWSIALDALKNIRSFFFGVGFANFSTLYTSVKPLSLNTTIFWNTLPTNSGSELLHLLTTGGILTTLSFVLLVVTTIRSLYSATTQDSKPLFIFAYITQLLVFIFAPGHIILYTLFFVTSALICTADTTTSHTTLAKTPRFITVGLLLLPTLVVLYFGGRYLLGEVAMRSAQVALANGDGQQVYEKNIAALGYMPWLTDYHLAFSQVNLRLASALSQKKDLSEQDRKTISQLIQQSINQAKATASLSPSSSTSWYNLATIYRNLIGVGSGAEEFAINYFNQAVTLDSANPSLRLEYGGLLYQLGTAQSSSMSAESKSGLLARASSEFQTAISLRPTYANAYYNLSKVLELRGEKDQAIQALQKTISLLDTSSADYTAATQELDLLTKSTTTPTTSAAPSPKAIQAPKADSTTELVQPAPLPSPITGGPIILPDDNLLVPSPVPTPTTSPTSSPVASPSI